MKNLSIDKLIKDNCSEQIAKKLSDDYKSKNIKISQLKNYIVILTILCLFLSACIYFRTGYFESSIQTIEATFYINGKDPIISNKYYRDLSGNWILLDKNYVITKDTWRATEVKNK